MDIPDISEIRKDVTKKEVERYFSKRRNWPVLAVIIIALAGLIVSGYFVLTHSSACSDEICFSEHLAKCKRAEYTSVTEDKSFFYKILGKENSGCEVAVELLQVKQGSDEINSLVGKEMMCIVPLGTTARPESNIKNCHGLLREAIQNIMIQRVQSQLVENIGEITGEMIKVI